MKNSGCQGLGGAVGVVQWIESFSDEGWESSRDLLYNAVPIMNNTVLHASNMLRKHIYAIFITIYFSKAIQTNPEDSRAYLLRTVLTWTSKSKLQSPTLQRFWVFKIVLNTQGRQREPVKEFSKTLSLQVTLTVQLDIQIIYSISILQKSRVLLGLLPNAYHPPWAALLLKSS